MTSKNRILLGQVTSKRDQVGQLLGEIEDLLYDIADADADASWFSQAVPTDAVPDRLVDLGRHLRQMFVFEEDEGYLSEAIVSQPSLRQDIERLHDEHNRLLAQLDDVCELAGSSVEPGSTWDDVELHYRGFARALTGHHRDEDALFQQAGAEQYC